MMWQFLIIAGAVLVGAQANQLLTGAVTVAIMRRRQKRDRGTRAVNELSARLEKMVGPCSCPDCTRQRELRVN